MKSQYRFTDRLPLLTEQEINKTKDFQALMDQRTLGLKAKRIRTEKIIKGLASSLLIIFIGLGVFYLNDLLEEQSAVQAVEISADNNLITEGTTENVNPPKPPFKTLLKTSELNENLATEAKAEVKKVKELPSSTQPNVESTNRQGRKNAYPQLGYQNASPIIGMDSLNIYLNQNLKYPAEVDKKLGVEGTSTVSFTINQAGEPTDISVENSLGAPFDNACKNLIRNMPRWEPAMQNGKAIDSRMSIILTFRIGKN